MNPKVSVVIAAHNHAHFLPNCPGPIKAQIYPDYEVIVIDNGSTDNTQVQRRACAILLVSEGKSFSETGRIVGMGRRMVRVWVSRFIPERIDGQTVEWIRNAN